jgi:hypothetical protein
VSVHEDMGAMREYLKTLFGLMYRYDVLMRECGQDPKWETELAFCVPLRQVVKLETAWIEGEGWEYSL